VLICRGVRLQVFPFVQPCHFDKINNNTIILNIMTVSNVIFKSNIFCFIWNVLNKACSNLIVMNSHNRYNYANNDGKVHIHYNNKVTTAKI